MTLNTAAHPNLLEGINYKIKVLKRMAYGFRDDHRIDEPAHDGILYLDPPPKGSSRAKKQFPNPEKPRRRRGRLKVPRPLQTFFSQRQVNSHEGYAFWPADRSRLRVPDLWLRVRVRVAMGSRHAIDSHLLGLEKTVLGWLALIGIAVGLAMDALAVAVATGLALPRITYRHVFRLSFHFGLFQFMMPIIGWVAGRTVTRYISAYDHWIACAMLSVIGGKMLWEAYNDHEAQTRHDPTRGLTLLTLSVATSIDALAVGLSLAFLDVSIWMPSIVIGIVAGLLTMLGIRFGNGIGERFEKWAEVTGGLVLIIIGFNILISHLT